MLKKFCASVLYITVLLGLPQSVFAGAGLDQRLQAVRQQRQAQQQAMQQQRQAVVAQQQLRQQQAVVMRQQMIQQQQVTAAQQRIIQEQLQRQAVNRQQIAYQQQLYQQQLQNQLPPQQPMASAPPSQNISFPAVGMHVEEVVDMKTIWEDFEISSEVWPLIIDIDAKEVIVAKFMEDFREQGVVFRQSTLHYVNLIDSMSFENPDMLKNSFDKVLQMVAIIEYDFGNGVNPDDLARRVLGDQAYKQNKKRLGK